MKYYRLHVQVNENQEKTTKEYYPRPLHNSRSIEVVGLNSDTPLSMLAALMHDMLESTTTMVSLVVLPVN